MKARNWKSLHKEVRICSHLLSFTFLIVVWIVLGIVKYKLYGMAGWGLKWNMKDPSFWLQAKTFATLHIRPYGILMLLGLVADQLMWPYFMRKEYKLKFD
jgi:hypothetical protein